MRPDRHRPGAGTLLGGRPDDAVLDTVRAALDDDLDTPTAVAAIDAAAHGGADVSVAAALLGVDLATPA